MSNEPENASNESPWPPQNFVSIDDFRNVDFNGVTRTITSSCARTLESAFISSAKQNFNVDPAFSVYRILASVCGLHFRPHDRSGAFGPQIVMDGRRSAIPDDWLGVQNREFAAVLPEVQHPALRARLADVVWTNDRKNAEAAAIAVDAYCECVVRLRSGELDPAFPSEMTVPRQATEFIERAVQIHARSSKRNSPIPNRLVETINDLFAAALEFTEANPLEALGSIILRHSIVSPLDLATQIEEAALKAEQLENAYPLSVKGLFSLAAAAFGEARMPLEQRRCQLKAVDQTVSMASQIDTSAAKVHWYRQAIGELRRIGDTTDQREMLRQEMRRHQEKSLDEMSTFSIPIDLSDVVAGTIAVFENISLPDALRQLAALAHPGDAKSLRSQAIEHTSVFDSIMTSTHVDAEGKIIAEVSAPSEQGEPDDKWIKSKMVQQLNIHIHITLDGKLEPARRFISRSFPISEQHFIYVSSQSPFIPESHTYTFALGFARLLQGDFLSATHLLLPQLEHCLRYVLVNSGIDTSKMKFDLTQEDRTISILLDTYRTPMESIFGEDITLFIDLLFNHRPGPALRHEFAHGKVGDSGTSDPVAIYACYFIYLLTCLPLLPDWATHVAPAIERGSF